MPDGSLVGYDRTRRRTARAQETVLIGYLPKQFTKATIFELNVESYRRRTAVENKHRRQRAPAPHFPLPTRLPRRRRLRPSNQKSSDRRVRGCHSWKLSEGPPTLWPRTLGAWPQKPAPYRPLSAFSPGRVGHGYPLDLAQADSSPRMPRLDLRTRPANLRSRRSANWLRGSAACVSHSGLSILSMRPRSGGLQGGSLPPDHSHQPTNPTNQDLLDAEPSCVTLPASRSVFAVGTPVARRPPHRSVRAR